MGVRIQLAIALVLLSTLFLVILLMANGILNS